MVKSDYIHKRRAMNAMNGYIRTMRAMIGKKPLMMCGASVIVIRDGKLLLQKRKDNGCWSYHGGCLELGERLEEAAVRELYEETGLKAGPLKLFGIFSGPELHHVYPNGDEVYVVDTVYVCDCFSGEEKAEASEVLELKWFPLDAVPDELNPPVRAILHKFINEYRNDQKERN
jgi:8-oxo-dGTP pyrophosphatase MutT (NUDIX family)